MTPFWAAASVLNANDSKYVKETIEGPYNK